MADEGGNTHRVYIVNPGDVWGGGEIEITGDAATDIDATATATAALAALISSGSLKAVLTAGSAAFGKLSANSGVDIGDVDVPLAASVFDVAESTSLGTSAAQLASHACSYGAVITNTHASQIVYVGGSTVSGTRFIHKLTAGQSSPLIPVANTNLLYVIGSGASTSFTYGGY